MESAACRVWARRGKELVGCRLPVGWQVIQDRWWGGLSFGTGSRLIGRPSGLWPAQMAVPPYRMKGRRAPQGAHRAGVLEGKVAEIVVPQGPQGSQGS
jgi:hypothetical protein